MKLKQESKYFMPSADRHHGTKAILHTHQDTPAHYISQSYRP